MRHRSRAALGNAPPPRFLARARRHARAPAADSTGLPPPAAPSSSHIHDGSYAFRHCAAGAQLISGEGREAATGGSSAPGRLMERVPRGAGLGPCSRLNAEERSPSPTTSHPRGPNGGNPLSRRFGAAGAAAERYARAPWACAEIRVALENAGCTIGPDDLIIAAHARVLGLTLVTDNLTEFSRVPSLRVQNWLSQHGPSTESERAGPTNSVLRCRSAAGRPLAGVSASRAV
jgi:hypothetical protein